MSSLRLEALRREVTRTAAFRLTLRFAVFFVACLLVLDLGLGLVARWGIERTTRAEIEEALDSLRKAHGAGGAAAVARLAAEFGGDADAGEIVAGLQTPDGALLAGGLVLPAPRTGWSVLAVEGVDEDEALWVKSVRLPDGGWLSAGTSSETYHDVAELMLAGAAWSVAIGLPLALISGALLSRAVLRRLAPIAETAGQVGEGDLARRAPLAGTGDEFDRLAGNINAMLDTIESLTRNLRNVSVGIAHELRSPLTRIRNRLVELSASGPGPERDAIDGALVEIDAALGTFDALLRIGQIEANAQRKGFEALDLSQLVSSLAEVYRPVAAEQGKQFSASVAPEVKVRGNRELLTQMIANLLENAIEHTPDGTSIRMELSASPDGPRLVVEDDGPGIPAEESMRVFDRFYRLDRSRSKPGNGLGLSLVKSICGLHGFAVRLTPSTSGAKFEVSI